MNTFDKLKDTVASILKVPASKITHTTRDSDIAAWDSIGHVQVMIAVEDTFGIHLDPEDFPRLTSIESIMECLRMHEIE